MVRITDIWDRTVEFLGDHLARVVPLAILTIFVPTSVNESVAGLWGTNSGSVRAVLFVVYLALALSQLWGQLAIAALAIDPAIGGNAGRVATTRLLPAIGVLAVLMIAGFVAILPVSLILAVSGVDLSGVETGTVAATMSAGSALAVTLYGVFLLAVALFVAARLTVLWPMIAAERRGIGAIAHAFRLTRGLTWRLIGVLILFIVVYSVAALAARAVFGTLLGLIAGGDGGFGVAGVITAIVVAAVVTVFTVLATVFCAKLYVAVRDRAAARGAYSVEDA